MFRSKGLYLIVVLLTGMLGLTGMAQPYTVTWKSGAVPVQCGQVITGSFAGASNDHDLYFSDSVVSSPERGFASGPERSYRFTLADSSYVYVRQTDGNRHGVIVCADSSNMHPFGALAYFKGLRLGAGTYYLNVEQDVDNLADRFSVQIQCLTEPLPGWPYVSVKNFAEPVQGAFFRLAGTLAQAQNRVDAYNVPTRFYPNPPAYVTYLPEPEKVYAFRVPETGQVAINNTGRSDHRVLVLDTSGNSWDVLPLTTMGGINARQGSSTLMLEAGTYYLSVEQGSSTVTSPYEYQVSWACRAGVPRIEYAYLWRYNSMGVQLNGQTQILQTSDDRQCPTCTQYADGFADDAKLLHIGMANNSLSVMSNPGYVRLYLDLNKDGDFDDLNEWFYTTRRRSVALTPDPVSNVGWAGHTLENVLTDNFTLPDSVYNTYAGQILRMRILATDTTIGSACAAYGYGQALDIAVKMDRPVIQDSATLWVRQISDREEDSLVSVEASRRGLVSFSKHYFGGQYDPLLPPGTYGGAAEVSLTQGAPGDRIFLRTGQAHHYDIPTYSQLIAFYRGDGSVAWTYPILATGRDGGTNPSLTSTTTDAQGSVYWTTATPPREYASWSDLFKIDSSGNYPILVLRHFNSHQSLVLDAADVDEEGGYCLAGRFFGHYSPDPKRLDLAVDTTGTRFVSLNRRGSKDVYVARYSSIRSLMWLVQGSGGHVSKPVRVVASTGSSGYILGTADTVTLFTGRQGDTLRFGREGQSMEYVVAVSDSGRLLWVKTISTGAIDKGLMGISIGDTGDLVLVGNFRDSCRLDAGPVLHAHGSQDVFALRMTRQGTVIWASQAGGVGAENVSRIRRGLAGSLYVTVCSRSNQALAEVFGKQAGTASFANKASLFKLDAITGKAQSWEGSVQTSTGFVASGGDGLSYTGLSSQGATPFVGRGRFFSTGLGTMSSWMDIFLAQIRTSAQLRDDYQVVQVQEDLNSAFAPFVFPNPTQGGINIRVSDGIGNTETLSIRDMLGREVYQKCISSVGLREGIHLSTSLRPGMYMVQCGARSSRLVVE